MLEISGSKLAELSGFTWRTCKRRLADAGVRPTRREGNADLFDSVAALRALYAPENGERSGLSLSDERAKLAQAQRVKIEAELAVRAGELLEAQHVIAEVGTMLMTFRQRLLALPDAVAVVLDAKTARLVVPEVRRKLYEAMDELSEYRPSSRGDRK